MRGDREYWNGDIGMIRGEDRYGRAKEAGEEGC